MCKRDDSPHSSDFAIDRRPGLRPGPARGRAASVILRRSPHRIYRDGAYPIDSGQEPGADRDRHPSRGPPRGAPAVAGWSTMLPRTAPARCHGTAAVRMARRHLVRGESGRRLALYATATGRPILRIGPTSEAWVIRPRSLPRRLPSHPPGPDWGLTRPRRGSRGTGGRADPWTRRGRAGRRARRGCSRDRYPRRSDRPWCVGPMRAKVAVAARQEDADFGDGGVFVGELPRASGGGADGSGEARPSTMASGPLGTRRR